METDLATELDLIRVSVAVGLGYALAGCSGVASNIPLSRLLPAPETDVVVTIDSNPPGALASASNGGTCQTPCALSTPVTDPFTVTYTLEGYLPQTVAVRPIPAAKTALIDMTPPTLEPNPVVAQLQPAPPPPPPPARKKRRP
jgi:hypothetical protein